MNHELGQAGERWRAYLRDCRELLTIAEPLQV